MPRTDLYVPYEDNEEVSRLGAQRDVTKMRWYVPDGMDLQPFERWLPIPDEGPASSPNIIASSYFIVRSKIRCLECNRLSDVFAFVLPPGFKLLGAFDDQDDADDGGEDEFFMGMVPFYIRYLSDSVVEQIRAATEHLRFDTQDGLRHPHWMNHCEHCGMPFDEMELFDEDEGPFGTDPYEGSQVVCWKEIDALFEAHADSRFPRSIDLP